MPRAEPEQLCLFDRGPDMGKIRDFSAAMKRQNRAPSTHVAYDCDWRTFEAWCRAAGRAALPSSGETLALYAAARLQEGRTAATVLRSISAVAHRHRAAGAPIPDRAEARQIAAGARRQRQEKPRKRRALTVAELRQICARLVRLGTVEALRSRAILTLGVGTSLRRSNLVALDVADVSFARRQGVAVTVRRTKVDQLGRGQVIGVFRGRRAETCPVRALRDWLAKRGERPGPLFTRIRDGRATLERLSAGTVNAVVKSCVELISLDPAGYGAHSLRSTFVTGAHVTGGADVLAIMEVTRHKTADMVREYLRDADPFAGSNPIAGVL